MKKPLPRDKTTAKKPNPTLEQIVKAAHEAGASVSFGLEAHNSFYGKMDEGVREWVRMLRNAGINTVSSSHSEGCIQAACVDPTKELGTISKVLHGRVPAYEVIIISGQYVTQKIQHLCIRSGAFKFEPKDTKPKSKK